jgi:hypothetical protein
VPAAGPTDLSASEDLNNSLYALRIGPGARIDLGDPAVFQFENELNREVITLSAWIKMTGSPMDDPSYDFTVFEYSSGFEELGFTARIYGGKTYSSTVRPPKISFSVFGDPVPPFIDQSYIGATAEGVENVPAQNEWSYVMFSYDRTATNLADGIKIWLDGRELPVSRTNTTGFSEMHRSATSHLSVGAQPLNPTYNSTSCDVYVDDILMRRYHRHPLDFEIEGLAGPESESYLGNYMAEALYTCGDYEVGLGDEVITENHYLPSGSDASHLNGRFAGDVEFVEPGAPGTRKMPAGWGTP